MSQPVHAVPVSASRRVPPTDDDLARRRLGFTVVAAFAAIAAAQMGDLGTFVTMVALGGLAAEANPIVAHIGSELGLELLVLLKVALIPFVALIFAALLRVRVRLAATVLTVATVAGVVGACSNVAALV